LVEHDLFGKPVPAFSGSCSEEIKKGLKSPCFRAPPLLAGGSSTPGDAPSYENSNHEMLHDFAALAPLLQQFPAAPFRLNALLISIVARRVKVNTAGIGRAPPRRPSNARLKSKRRGIVQTLTLGACHSAAAISRRSGQQFAGGG
jgi:hypothetical protein